MDNSKTTKGESYGFTDMTFCCESEYDKLKTMLAKGFDVYTGHEELKPNYNGIEQAFKEYVYGGGIKAFLHLPTQLITTEGFWTSHDKDNNVTKSWGFSKNTKLISKQGNLFVNLEKCEPYHFILMCELDDYYIFSCPISFGYDSYVDDDGVLNHNEDYCAVMAVKKNTWDGYVETLYNTEQEDI